MTVQTIASEHRRDIKQWSPPCAVVERLEGSTASKPRGFRNLNQDQSSSIYKADRRYRLVSILSVWVIFVFVTSGRICEGSWQGGKKYELRDIKGNGEAERET